MTCSWCRKNTSEVESFEIPDGDGVSIDDLCKFCGIAFKRAVDKIKEECIGN